MTLGQRLRILRLLEGWSQRHLAQVLHLSPRTVGFAESEAYGILSSRSWEHLAAIFGVHIDWLMYERSPVFLPTLRIYEVPEPPQQRTWRMISEGLADLGGPFVRAIHTKAIFRFRPGLAVLQLADGWVLLVAPAFVGELQEALYHAERLIDRSAISLPPISPRAHGPLIHALAPHLSISSHDADILIHAWEAWLARRDSWLLEETLRGTLSQIAALIRNHQIPVERVLTFLASEFPPRP